MWKSWEKCKHTSRHKSPQWASTQECAPSLKPWIRVITQVPSQDFTSLCPRWCVPPTQPLQPPQFQYEREYPPVRAQASWRDWSLHEWPWWWQESRMHLRVKGGLQPGLVTRAHNPSHSRMGRRGVAVSKAAWEVQWEPVSKWGLERALKM